jgi:hypothetical protein
MRVRAGILAAAVSLGAAADARAAGYPACLQSADQAHVQLTQPTKSTATPVTIPGEGKVSYQGDVYAPRPMPIHSGKGAPLAVVMHGIDGNPCSVRWIARFLAHNGYLAVDVYRPPTTDPVARADDRSETLLHAAAIRAAVEYARSPQFPYWMDVDTSNFALVGHSLGASASGVLQSELGGITAYVALDGLRHWAVHDPGLPFNCSDTPDLELTPVVPALGLMSSVTCPQHRPDHVGQLRKTGFKRWSGEGVDTVVVALRKFEHGSFTGQGTGKQLGKVAKLMRRWLGHYMRGESGKPYTGVPDKWLSKKYASGAFLPDFNIDCEQLFSCGP